MNTQTTHTVWNFVDECTGFAEFDGTKAECEDFVANADARFYDRLEIQEVD